MLEMKLIATSFSAVVPKTKIGINIFSGTYLAFRVGGAIHYYGMQKSLSSGGTGTLGVAQVDTNWFLMESTEKRKDSIPSLDNQLVRLELDGLVTGFGSVDIKFTVYDSNNSPFVTIERIQEPARGLLLASFSLTERLKKIATK